MMNDVEENKENRAGRRPDFIAYVVTPIGVGEDSAWNRVGAAWQHRDGQGYDVSMDALPVAGRLTLRAPPARETAATADGGTVAPQHD